MAGVGTQIEGAGFNVGATWGTEVALGTDDGIKLQSEDIRGGEEPLQVEELGDPVMQPVELGNKNHAGPLRGLFRYGGNCARLFAFLLGGDDNVTANTGTSTHKVQLANENDKFLTFCRGVDSSAKWWAWPSIMFESGRFFFEAGGRASWELQAVANTLQRNSTANARAVTSLVTVPAGIRQVMGTDVSGGGFLVNDQSSGALSSGDSLGKVIGLEFSIRRPISKDHTVEGGDSIVLPDEDGQIDALVRVTFSRYPGDALIAEWEAKTEKKGQVTFSSGITPGDTEATLQFQFPRMTLAERPQAPVQGVGPVAFSVLYRLHTPSAAPTGMDALATTPALMISEDNRLTDYFA